MADWCLRMILKLLRASALATLAIMLPGMAVGSWTLALFLPSVWSAAAALVTIPALWPILRIAQEVDRRVLSGLVSRGEIQKNELSSWDTLRVEGRETPPHED